MLGVSIHNVLTGHTTCWRSPPSGMVVEHAFPTARLAWPEELLRHGLGGGVGLAALRLHIVVHDVASVHNDHAARRSCRRRTALRSSANRVMFGFFVVGSPMQRVLYVTRKGSLSWRVNFRVIDFLDADAAGARGLVQTLQALENWRRCCRNSRTDAGAAGAGRLMQALQALARCCRTVATRSPS